MGVLKHAAACRSMPHQAKIFTWRTFFFIICRTCEPFVAQMSQNWMVAQWSMYKVTVWKVLGSIHRKGNFLPVSRSPLLHRSSLFWCIGKVLGTTSACLPCLSAPALFARETFCLPHVSPVCFYLSCHESVICTNNRQSRVNTKHTRHLRLTDASGEGRPGKIYCNLCATWWSSKGAVLVKVIDLAQQCCACCLLRVSSIPHRSVGTHMCRQKHAAACRSVPQHKKFFRGTALACLRPTSTGGGVASKSEETAHP